MAQRGKESARNAGDAVPTFLSLGDPLRMAAPIPVFSLWGTYGQSNLARAIVHGVGELGHLILVTCMQHHSIKRQDSQEEGEGWGGLRVTLF